MTKTICPICNRELNTPLHPGFLLCPNCQVAVRVSGTLAKEPDRLGVYSTDYVEGHSNNPIAHDIAKHTARVVGSVLPKGATVLDIGCSSGLLVDRLARAGYEAFGIDWSEPAIEFARKSKNGSFLAANVDDLAPELLGFKLDLVVASHILEHLENPHEFLQSAREIMEPDGYLVIVVPNFAWYNPNSIYRSVSVLFDPEHVVGYSPKGLRKLLDANGYRVEFMTTRTHGLAILTAAGITVYRALRLFHGEQIHGVKSGYVRTTSDGVVARVLAWGMRPFNRMSEQGLRGMELIVVARKGNG